MTDYATALGVAELAMERLRPHCEKIELAGSLRRGRPQVSDIELVCQPKLVAGQASSSQFLPPGDRCDPRARG